MNEITRVLSSIAQGDPMAADRLFPLVYAELRDLARRSLSREKPGHTLQPTALVHEAYLRLIGEGAPRAFEDLAHFFAAAATAMRRILVSNARRKHALKRGGAMNREEREEIGEAAAPQDGELLALDEALQKLAEKDPDKAKLVELRYFAGLTGEQAASVLGISPTTADRHWAYARAWLQAEIRGR